MTNCRLFLFFVLAVFFVPHCAYCSKTSNTGKTENKQTSVKITESKTTDKDTKNKEIQTSAENLISQLKKTEGGQNIINGASVGAVGIGGQMIASGVAEKMSDEESAKDMDAYKSSMYCIVGNNGERVSVGSEYELPITDSDFKSLRDEYIATLDRVRKTREALGMEVGPEYSLNFDKDGLYEYQHTEQQKLLDTASERLTKSDSDDKIENGAIAAIAGLVVPYVQTNVNASLNNKIKNTNKSGTTKTNNANNINKTDTKTKQSINIAAGSGTGSNATSQNNPTKKSGTSTDDAGQTEDQKFKKECEQACKQNREVATKYGCEC